MLNCTGMKKIEKSGGIHTGIKNAGENVIVLTDTDDAYLASIRHNV